MKKLLFLVQTVALAFTLKIGSLPLLETGGEVFPDLYTLNLVLNVISDFLGYPPPVFENDRLIFNRNVLEFSNGLYRFNSKVVDEGFMRPDVILGAFGIRTVFDNGAIVVPECILESVDRVSNSFRVSYMGNPAFEYVQAGTFIEIVSKGYVLYGNRIYLPGEMMEIVPMGEANSIKVVEYRDHDVVIMSFIEKVRKLIMARYGNWKGKPISVDDFLVLIGKGEGTVIIRPYSSDLKGLDVGAFERSKRIGKRIAEILGYRLEICPLLELPVGGGAVAIFTNEDVEKVKRVVFKVVGYSDLVDLIGDGG